jgi:hypothetical protein
MIPAFIVGVFVGMLLGLFVAGLCAAASEHLP